MHEYRKLEKDKIKLKKELKKLENEYYRTKEKLNKEIEKIDNKQFELVNQKLF